MVVIVAVLLSLAALSLQKRQYANELGEKKNNILQSLGVPDGDFDAMWSTRPATRRKSPPRRSST